MDFSQVLNASDNAIDLLSILTSQLKSLLSFRMRELTTFATLWVSCFWVVPTRKHSWLQELSKEPCCFYFLAMKDSHTVSVGNSCSGCQRNCSFCSLRLGDPLGRVKLPPHFSSVFNQFLLRLENCFHISRNPLRTSVLSALQEYLHVAESHRG